jgi:hypothetical protein
MVLGAADKLRNVVFGLYRHAVKCSAIVNQAGFCWLRRPLAFSLSVNTADRFATRTENLRATRCRRGNAVASSRRQLLLEATMALVDYIEMFSEPAPPTADDRPAQSCQIRAASNCHETPCTNGMMRSECRDPHKSTSASRVRRRSRPCTAITTGRNIISTRSLNRSDTSTGRRSRDSFVGLPIRRSSPCTRRPV